MNDDRPRRSDPGFDAQQRAMRSGRGRFVAAAVLAALGALALLITALLSGDDLAPYRTLGRNVTAAKGAFFDGFWDCALGGPERLSNNEDLEAAVHRRAEMGGRRFVELLRDRCMEKLVELGSRLRALIPPNEFQSDLDELIQSSARMRAGTADYLSYLEERSGPYERQDAQDRVRVISRAWFEFRRAYSALQEKLVERLEAR